MGGISFALGGDSSQLESILPTCKDLCKVWFKTLHRNSRSRCHCSILQMGKLKLNNLPCVGRARKTQTQCLSQPGLSQDRGLTTQKLLSHGLEVTSPRSRCWQGQLLLRPFFFACGWMSSPHVFKWSSLCLDLCLNFLFL